MRLELPGGEDKILEVGELEYYRSSAKSGNFSSRTLSVHSLPSYFLWENPGVNPLFLKEKNKPFILQQMHFI